MYKRAVILHGKDGSPLSNWQPWLKKQLEANGYEVWAPALPDFSIPNWQSTNSFLLSRADFIEGSVMIGHSAGATSILNLLSDHSSPSIAAAVLVGAFFELNPERAKQLGAVANEYAMIRPDGQYDYDYLKTKSNSFYFIHGDNDPICPVEVTLEACKSLDGQMVTILNASLGIEVLAI